MNHFAIFCSCGWTMLNLFSKPLPLDVMTGFENIPLTVSAFLLLVVKVVDGSLFVDGRVVPSFRAVRETLS